MEVKRFFVMLDAARRISARRYQVQCDIAAISIANAEYQKELKDSFTRRWDAEREIAEAVSQLEGVDAQNALKGLFTG